LLFRTFRAIPLKGDLPRCKWKEFRQPKGSFTAQAQTDRYRGTILPDWPERLNQKTVSTLALSNFLGRARTAVVTFHRRRPRRHENHKLILLHVVRAHACEPTRIEFIIGTFVSHLGNISTEVSV
jgi:hypothetical protein